MKKQYTSNEIKTNIIGKTFYGKHPPNFEYIIAINADGTLEGKNNSDHHDWGKWELNDQEHTLSVCWENGWQNNTSKIQSLDGIIQLVDVETKQVNTYLNHEIQAIKDISKYRF